MQLITLFSLISLLCPSAYSVTLEEAFRSTLEKNERIGEEKQKGLALEEQISQIKGGIYPQISITGEHKIQPKLSDPAFDTFSPSNQTTVSIGLNQTLFRGLREWAGLRRARHLKTAHGANEDQTLIDLFQELATTYLQILTLEEDLKNLKEQLQIYSLRADQIKARLGRGESSQSETLSAESAEAAVSAEIELIKGQLDAAREHFAYLTGLSASTPVKDPEVLKEKLPSLDQFLEGIEVRPDIKSAVERLAAAEEMVSVAWGAHLPSLDLYGNYYLERPGFLKDLDWDVGIRLTVPLFEGGTVQARVREASAHKGAADLELQRTRRFAQQEIRSLYRRLSSRLEHLEKLKKSVALSKSNVEVLQKDYKRGLARNIDVHLALSESSTAIRGYGQARFAAQLEFFQLQAASGQTPEPMKALEGVK